MGVEFPPLQETNRPTNKTNNTQNHGVVKKDTHETNANLTTTNTWNRNKNEEKYTTQEQLNNITKKYKDDIENLRNEFKTAMETMKREINTDMKTIVTQVMTETRAMLQNETKSIAGEIKILMGSFKNEFMGKWTNTGNSVSQDNITNAVSPNGKRPIGAENK